MSIVDQQPSRSNFLIASLPRADREGVLGACEGTELIFGETVYKAGEAMTHVYFPTSGYISLITPPEAAESLEVGMVGTEGMFGITTLLGVNTSPWVGLVQGGGTALRMSLRRFARAAEQSVPFQKTLNLYLYVLTMQLAQTAACNRFHNLEARTARWLLMTQDRAASGTFRLTHAFLAHMLGVRRAGITEIAGLLQSQGLIRYARGIVTVLDRPRLEAISCGCYRSLKATYSKYLNVHRANKNGGEAARRKISDNSNSTAPIKRADRPCADTYHR